MSPRDEWVPTPAQAQLLARLLELEVLMGADEVDIDAIMREAGPVVGTPRAGSLIPLELSPTVPGAARITLAPHPGTQTPYLLTIEPIPEAMPTIGILSVEFGEARRAVAESDRPYHLVFAPRSTRSAHPIALIAVVDSLAGDMEAAVVILLRLRRGRP